MDFWYFFRFSDSRLSRVNTSLFTHFPLPFTGLGHGSDKDCLNLAYIDNFKYEFIQERILMYLTLASCKCLNTALGCFGDEETVNVSAYGDISCGVAVDLVGMTTLCNSDYGRSRCCETCNSLWQGHFRWDMLSLILSWICLGIKKYFFSLYLRFVA